MTEPTHRSNCVRSTQPLVRMRLNSQENPPRFYGISILIGIANIAIFVLMWWPIRDQGLTNERLLAWGANFAPLTLTGQPWRLLTGAFLHGGWTHLFMNMYMLAVLGPLLERTIGALRFIVVYLLSALGASLLSAYWFGHHQVGSFTTALGVVVPAQGIHPVVSVGASGALMGLAAAAAAVCLRHAFIRRQTQEAPVPISGSAIGQVIAINLLSGFFVSGIDQAAHVGGVIVGFVVGLIVNRPRRSGPRAWRQVGVLTLGAAGTLAIVAAALHGSSPELRQWRVAFEKQLAQNRLKAEREQQAQAMAEQAKFDAQHRPPFVSAAVAAGTTLPVGKSPYAMALGPTGKRLYVTSMDDNELTVLDLEKRAVLRTIRGEPFSTGLDGCPGNMCRGRGAAGVVVSPDERYAYVASMRENGVVRIDLAQGAIVDSAKVGVFPRTLIASPAHDTLYVFNGVDDTISVISLSQWPKVVATLNLGGSAQAANMPFGRPLSMWLSHDGSKLYAYAVARNAIVAFDTSSNTVVRTYPVGSDFFSAVPAPSGSGVWLYSQASLDWADPTTLAANKQSAICQNSMYNVDTSDDGKYLAVSDYNRSSVQVIKTATHSTVGEYPAPSALVQTIFAPDHRTLYALGVDGTVSIIDREKSVDYTEDGADKAFFCPASQESSEDDS